MRGWPVVIGIIGGAALLGFALKALPAGVVIVIALAAIAYVSLRMRRIVRSTKQGVAAQTLGFERSPTDPFALLSLPLGLFARGTDHVVADVMWGTWAGTDVKLFELRFTDELGIDRTFACALAPSAEPSTPVVVEPRAFLVPTREAVALPEVDVGDEAFARAFEVRAEDAERAILVLTPPFRQRLAALQERWGFEIRERMLLCYSAAEAVDPLESLETVTSLRRELDPSAA